MTTFVPLGFRFAGVHAGLKTNSAYLDLSLVVSDFPATAAGVYTTNLLPGGHVLCDRERTPSEGIRTVVINSRVSNSCTGEQGYHDALTMASWGAEAIGADAAQGLCMSTGVIGVLLPMDKIRAGISAAAEQLAPTAEGLRRVVWGMMTTDTQEKIVSRKFLLPQQQIEITITGICKGAAMIGPNMATMLGLWMTDAKIERNDAQHILACSTEVSFNCISVEGHMSTCDTVLFLANGAATQEKLGGKDLAFFAQALEELSIELAQKIPQDGEGATHFVAIDVCGCATRSDAKKIAKTVAESALVKTAIYGADPNWGRILSAAGYAGVAFNPHAVRLELNGFVLYADGKPQGFSADEVSRSIRTQRNTKILLGFTEGDASIRFWTTDLTPEYVHLNADYTT